MLSYLALSRCFSLAKSVQIGWELVPTILGAVANARNNFSKIVSFELFLRLVRMKNELVRLMGLISVLRNHFEFLDA